MPSKYYLHGHSDIKIVGVLAIIEKMQKQKMIASRARLVLCGVDLLIQR